MPEMLTQRERNRHVLVQDGWTIKRENRNIYHIYTAAVEDNQITRSETIYSNHV